MAGLQFVCEKCGKTITAYKEVTSGRRKCSGCGSYGLRKVVPVSGQTVAVSAPMIEFSPKVAEISDSELPAVSIVIPTYNGKPHLEKCLPALRAIDYPLEKVEVIVVDNASSDGTAAFLKTKFPWVKLLRQEINHYCRANNLGIKAANGEYIALLNNDTKVEKGWLSELVKVIHPNPEIGAVGSKVLLLSGRIHTTGHYEQPNFHWGDRGFEEEDKGQYDEIEEIPSLCGVSVLYRRECIDDVGLLDERFVAYYEDVDMSLRCRKKGWKLVYVPKSVVHHFYNGTAANLQQEGISFTRYYTERNRLLLLAKHQPDKLPDSLSSFSHFYVDKDYRILYQALPVVLSGLFESADSRDLPDILARLFDTLRKIAVYESEGIRTERLIYQQRLSALEKEWQENLARELKLKEDVWHEEAKKREIAVKKEQKALEEGYSRELEKRDTQLKEQEKKFQASRDALVKTHSMDLDRRDAQLKEGYSRELEKRDTQLKEQEKSFHAVKEEHVGKISAQTVRIHLLEHELEQKTKEIASLREDFGRRDCHHKEEIARLREDLLRREQNLGQLSYELAVARQHPFTKLSTRLKLGVYRQGTKEALIAQLGNRLAAKERDLNIALTKLDAEYARFRAFQKDNEEKVAQFLAAEQRATDLNAEVLALQKRLAVHEGEVGALVGEVARLRAGAAVPPGSVPDEPPQETPSELPAEVHYSITAKCNFRCRHCDIWKQEGCKGKGGGAELSTEGAKALITRLHGALGARTLHIAGGEPFLRKDLFEVLGHACSLGFSTIITSNGSRINERVAEQIATLAPKAVNVSLDGLEETHDAIRGVPGSYRRAVRALELLNAAKKGTHVILTTVVNSLNLGQLEDLVRLAESMSLDGIAFQALTNEFSSAYRPDWWQSTDLWPADAAAIDRAISGLVRLKLAGSPITNSIAHLEHMRHYFTHPGAYPGECRIGSRTLHLNEKGQALLCWNMPPLGNALTDDLASLWVGDEAKGQREHIRRCSRECFILNCNYL